VKKRQQYLRKKIIIRKLFRDSFSATILTISNMCFKINSNGKFFLMTHVFHSYPFTKIDYYISFHYVQKTLKNLNNFRLLKK